jgi:hypothetical protein
MRGSMVPFVASCHPFGAPAHHSGRNQAIAGRPGRPAHGRTGARSQPWRNPAAME